MKFKKQGEFLFNIQPRVKSFILFAEIMLTAQIYLSIYISICLIILYLNQVDFNHLSYRFRHLLIRINQVQAYRSPDQAPINYFILPEFNQIKYKFMIADSQIRNHHHIGIADLSAIMKRISGKIDEIKLFDTRQSKAEKGSYISNDRPSHDLDLNGHLSHLKTMLEPRDRELMHTFNFQVNIEEDQFRDGRSLIYEYPFYIQLIEQIRLFLVEAVSNIVSIAFNMLLKGELQSGESKEYAAKNIMLNVQTGYRKVIKFIENHEVLKAHIGQEDLKILRVKICIDIDEILNNIAQNLGDGYPEAPAVGGTLRMNEVLNQVNRMNNQQNDFIFANNIKISDFIPKADHKASGRDFTQFIMTVINTAIESVESKVSEKEERTMKQQFISFNEQLFWCSLSKNYQSIVTQLTSKEKKIIQKQLIEHQFSEETIKGNSSFSIFNLKVASAEQIQSMKKELHYAIGQKIPSSVKPFSKREIANKQFVAQHSSVLRVLTKWAGYLEQIFENHEEYVKQRHYPFKTEDNEQVYLNKYNKTKLSDSLARQYEHVKQKFQIILKNSYSFISDFLKEEKPKASNVLRYAQTKVLSSKIRTVLTSLTLKYTSILIDHLLRAGEGIDTKDGNRAKNISLVVFRVGDLMRSKLQCNQTNFINILKQVYFLDNHEQMKNKFKLVRIKNKLNQSANNIIINYLFMGKIQCELQLSIQEPKPKQKMYHTFSHFLYQLGRGRFGALAECGIMVSQLDPMITFGDNKNGYYTQKKAKPVVLDFKKMIESQHIKNINHEVNSLVFYCPDCKRDRINEKRDIFVREEHQLKCNECLIKSKEINAQQKLVNTKLSEMLRSESFQRLRTYEKCDDMNERYILKIDKKGKVSLNIVLYIRKELKTFFVRIDSNMLNLVKQNDIHMKDIEYCNVTDLIRQAKKDKKQCTHLLYSINEQQIFQQICHLIHINFEQFEKNKEKIKSVFRDFREEKYQIKRIKFKAQILRRSKNQNKWHILDKSLRILVLNDKEQTQTLKYRRYCNLSISNIKDIQAQQNKLTMVPKWIQQCSNLKFLDLSNNIISTIYEKDLPLKLSFIDLSQNNIEKIDVSHLKQLKKLNISNNSLKKIKIEEQNILSHLLLGDNKLQQFNMKHVPNIEQIDLKSNRIKQIEMKNLQKIMKIDLSQNQLKSVYCSNLLKLKQLTLINNKQLQTIQILNLEQLEYFNLSNNNLSKVLLVQIPKLHTLDLSHNMISQSSSLNIPSFTELKILKLNDNRIKQINIDSLTELQELFVNGNELTDINLENNKKIQTVNLSYNNILTQLNLSENIQLSKLQIHSNDRKLKVSNFPHSESLKILEIDKEVLINFLKNKDRRGGLKQVEKIRINGRLELSPEQWASKEVNQRAQIEWYNSSQ